MNLHSAGFASYWIALIACGGLLIALGITRFGRMSRVERVANVVVGLAFAGYGGYLGFAATTRTMYLVLLVLPAILLANDLNGWWTRRKAKRITEYRPVMETNLSGLPVISGSTMDAVTQANAEAYRMNERTPG